MKFAILRIQKLKSGVAVRRSLKHAFREHDTPNANAKLTQNNTHIGAGSSLEAIEKFNEGLPTRLRKNGVLCVEYLITASPEVMKTKTLEEQNQFFKDSLRWLHNKHGADNVFYAGLHRDETTPHMCAYVLPKDARGKMNAFSYFGGRDALSAMQDDFMDNVGVRHGLERGVKGSKARHRDIKQYYGQVEARREAEFDGFLNKEASRYQAAYIENMLKANSGMDEAAIKSSAKEAYSPRRLRIYFDEHKAFPVLPGTRQEDESNKKEAPTKIIHTQAVIEPAEKVEQIPEPTKHLKR